MKQALMLTAVTSALVTASVVAGEASAQQAYQGQGSQSMTSSGQYSGGGMGQWMPWNWVRGNEVYGSVKGGTTWLQNSDLNGPDAEYDTGLGGNLAVGKYINPNVRGEIELGYYTNDVDSVNTSIGKLNSGGDATAWTGMANIYYEPYAHCMLKPYVGAGAGIANVDLKAKTLGIDDDDTVFAGQAMAGVSYQFSPQLAATAEYRYLKTADLDVGSKDDVNYQNHMALVGLRAKF